MIMGTSGRPMPVGGCRPRDDIQLDPARLDFWSLKPFDHWKLLGDGMYGKVFGTRADPAVQVGDRRFCKLALKVPKQIGAEELKGEVESLSQLAHENVLQILGMMHGKTKGSGEEKQWALALEWCESDLTNLLYKPEAADPDGIYKPLPKMCELMEQIAQGLAYIHAQQRPHLDLKPDNILLAKAAAGRYVAKLADFGMAYERKQLQAVGDGSAGDTGGSAPKAPQAVDPEEIEPEKIAPFGTWEYIGPECYKRKYNNPSFESDVFSFGVLMWEMLSRRRIADHLLDEHNAKHRCIEDGKEVLNVKLVPELFVKGERPRYTGLQADARDPGQCGHVYYRLMQACWLHANLF